MRKELALARRYAPKTIHLEYTYKPLVSVNYEPALAAPDPFLKPPRPARLPTRSATGSGGHDLAVGHRLGWLRRS